MNESERILVVDDEPKVRVILRTALQRLGEGFQVVAARNGRQALGEIRRKAFDLVITDLRMPDMSGIQLTEEAKVLNPDAAILWITGCGCAAVARDSERLDVYRCLDKPIRIGQIRKVVLEALENVHGNR